MIRPPSLRGVRALLTLVCCLGASDLSAAERYALIVTGASGGSEYAQKYDTWRTGLVTTLKERFGYPADHLLVLAEEASVGTGKATRDNVRAAFADLRRRAAKDDVVLVLLIGHGSGGDVDEAKFNLVGPDMGADEWGALVRPIAARVVFVNTASGSFPFLKAIAAPNRIVVTANDATAQQFETIFPEFFLKAFAGEDGDLDKNGRVSMWEAFTSTSDEVRDWFESRGQLPTERPLLDDTGRGLGRESGTEGPDGMTAQVTYLQPEPPIVDSGDSELTGLMRRRAQLQAQLEQLKARKPSLLPDDYETELEKLLLELARVDRRIRSRS